MEDSSKKDSPPEVVVIQAEFIALASAKTEVGFDLVLQFKTDGLAPQSYPGALSMLKSLIFELINEFEKEAGHKIISMQDIMAQKPDNLN
jgi:hypothetical protein